MQFNAHKYQKDVIEDVLNNPKYMLCLDMGLGKTVITLTAIRAMQRVFSIGAALVIAPLSVARNTWSSEAAKWEHLSSMRVSLILGTEAQRLAALSKPADLYVVNRENTQWLCSQLPDLSTRFDMLVIDESSSFKSRGSQRFKALKKASINIPRILLLTGTPAPNGYEDLWAQYYLLDRGQRLGTTMSRYLAEHFRPLFGSGNIVYKYGLKLGGKDSITRKVADITRSMKAEDYLTVPSIVYIDQALILSEAVAEDYKRFTRDLVLQLPEKEITAQTAVALSNKLQQYTSGAVYDESGMTYQVHSEKIDALRELVETAQASGENVLLFYQYKHEVPRIVEALSAYKPTPFSGDPATLSDWNAGKIKVLLAHPASVSYGLNMQHGGHVIVWYSLTWSLEQYQQANARLHRQGQQTPVRVYHFIARGTIDEKIRAALSGKGDMQDALLAEITRIRAEATEKAFLP